MLCYLFPFIHNHFLSFQMVTRTKKIFVGGLSASTTLDDVKAYFSQFGKVSATSILKCKEHYYSPRRITHCDSLFLKQNLNCRRQR